MGICGVWNGSKALSSLTCSNELECLGCSTYDYGITEKYPGNLATSIHESNFSLYIVLKCIAPKLGMTKGLLLQSGTFDHCSCRVEGDCPWLRGRSGY
jgi:hypothetical protein